MPLLFVIESTHAHIPPQLPPYFTVTAASQALAVRRSDLRIRISDICRASSKSKRELSRIRNEFPDCIDNDFKFNYRGTYIDFWIGVELCRRYHLIALEKQLVTLKGIPPRTDLKNIQQGCAPKFIEIKEFCSAVLVRTSDLRVNAAHVFKIITPSRQPIIKLRNTLKPEVYDILRGDNKYQGTYVNLDVAIELCRRYELSELEKRLNSTRRTDHVDIWDEKPVSPPFDRQPAIQGSTDASPSHGPSSAVQKSPAVPSHQPIFDVAPHSLVGSEGCGLPTTSKHDLYEAWDSQPQFSRLTEFKPSSLQPLEREETLRCGESLGDLCSQIQGFEN